MHQWPEWANHRLWQIAVPSIGSNLMHRSWHPRCRSLPRNCSTLNRVEPHASCGCKVAARPPLSLQYPESGRTSCIRTYFVSASVQLVLQYPESGRTSCIFAYYLGLLSSDWNCSELHHERPYFDSGLHHE